MKLDMFGKSDEELLLHAVKIAARSRGRKVAWAKVMDAFGVGSTLAGNLCLRAGINPDSGL